MDLKEFLRSVRRSWWIVLCCVCLAALAGSAYILLRHPTYAASSKVFVAANQASSVADLSQGTNFTQQAVKSYADVATSPIVLDPVIDKLHLNTTAAALSQSVTSSAPLDTTVVEISVNADSPVQAADIANGISSTLSAVVTTLTPTTGNSEPSVKITQIERALPSATPAGPSIWLLILASAIAGLMVGLIFSALRTRLDTRVRSAHDLGQVSNRPLVGAIPSDIEVQRRPLVVFEQPNTPQAEAFRTLRTNLQFLQFPDAQRRFVVTSSVEGEGKTTTAANLAIAIAKAGQSVVVVDADIRRPKLASYFGLEESVGLTDLLIRQVAFDDAVQRWGSDENLHVLPAGQRAPNPSELLQSTAMIGLIEELSDRFDTIIFDAPPLLPVSDAAILAKRLNGAFVIAAAGKVRQQQLRTALAGLDRVGAPVLGLVMTMVPTSGPDSYGYGYGTYAYDPELERMPTPVSA